MFTEEPSTQPSGHVSVTLWIFEDAGYDVVKIRTKRFSFEIIILYVFVICTISM